MNRLTKTILTKTSIALTILIVLAACGRQDKETSNPLATGTSSRPNTQSTSSNSPLQVVKSLIKRSYSTLNGRVALSYVFMTFVSSAPSTSITDVKVRINGEGEPIPLMTRARIGVVNTASLSSMTFSKDPAEQVEIMAELQRDRSGNTFVFLNGVPEQIATGANEFLITFSANGQTKTISVITK